MPVFFTFANFFLGVDQLIKLKPHMVVIHNEAEVHHMDFAAKLHKEGIKAGLAILRDTPIEHAYQIMHSFDQVLVFSGDLGKHGGVADLGQQRLEHAEPSLALPAEAGVVRAALGGTINDTILAVITGALRGWLQARGVAVGQADALKAMLPISIAVPSAASGHAGGNRVSATLVDGGVSPNNNLVISFDESHGLALKAGGDGVEADE